jgi:hypothetical protein
MTASLSLAFLHFSGGGDFFMASKHGVYVHGVDLSVNMVTTALERAFAAKDGHKVLPSLSVCTLSAFSSLLLELCLCVQVQLFAAASPAKRHQRYCAHATKHLSCSS